MSRTIDLDLAMAKGETLTVKAHKIQPGLFAHRAAARRYSRAKRGWQLSHHTGMAVGVTAPTLRELRAKVAFADSEVGTIDWAGFGASEAPPATASDWVKAARTGIPSDAVVLHDSGLRRVWHYPGTPKLRVTSYGPKGRGSLHDLALGRVDDVNRLSLAEVCAVRLAVKLSPFPLGSEAAVYAQALDAVRTDPEWQAAIAENCGPDEVARQRAKLLVRAASGWNAPHDTYIRAAVAHR